MATVYLAEDQKHKRKVALKVLRPELAAVLGAERFVQEITTTAGLQHPHILPLFDSGEADSFLYYVMPFIDGETLRDRLNRDTQLGIEEAVQIASDVADALHYAHQQGIIHRDIKPENILMHNGRPMVADFGIALAVSAAAGGRMTETGLSLGTPHYMSPEQATAEKELTARSDVYSLGSVLYEMLTGEPPHTGASAQAIVMKIVMDDARPVTDLRKAVPHHVAAATATALAKLPADRFESAAKFAEALGNPGFAMATTAQGSSVPADADTPRRPRSSIALVGFGVLMTLAALAGWLRPRPDPAAPVIRYRVVADLTTGGQSQFGTSIALSPDGENLVYVGEADGSTGSQLWLQRRDQLDTEPILGSEDAHQPFFSPDGRRVAFIPTTAREIRVASLGGEPPVTLVDSDVYRLGGSWGEDGYLYYTRQPNGALARVPQGGGTVEQVSTVDSAAGETRHAWAEALPGGAGVLVTVQRGGNAVSEQDDIAVVDLRTGETRVLVRGLLARYATTGHLVFVRFDGAVLAAPFDVDRLELTGPAVPLLGSVTAGVRGPDFALSRSGRLVYLTGEAAAARQGEVIWLDRAGQMSRVDPSWTTIPAVSSGVALSPDDTRLAVALSGPDGVHVWVKQVSGGPAQRLTFEGGTNFRPQWTRDGASVLFLSNRVAAGGAAMGKRADGSGTAEVLATSERGLVEVIPVTLGEGVLLRNNDNDIVLLRPGVDSIPRMLLGDLSAVFTAPTVSPDGRWLAYSSNETGRFEIFVKPFPEVDAGRWQISTAGGMEPLWAHSGRELFYKNGAGELVSVAVTTEPTFAPGASTSLFELPDGVDEGTLLTTYDVTADDRRFLMLRRSGDSGSESAGRELIVVENFYEELKAKLAN
jgi:serine/threonine-protein kinase